MSADPAVFRRAPYAHVCPTCADYLATLNLPASAEQQAAFANGRRSPCPRCGHPGTRCDRCLAPAPQSVGKRCEGCGQVVAP